MTTAMEIIEFIYARRDVVCCEGCGKPGTSFCTACRAACVCSACVALRGENHDPGDEDRS